ncbi:TadE family type IV pilus minor pilin [Kitasatospora purpeofusca]|uniref:TadE family type IV pilus minor pilin n=1 Tax=Kitasatospora purpeofusca TaxID=67352 RepID=UPI00224D930A|nr:TadE family type IV pilus minor pilin [Kitasatospora purpeofusca]MCX4754269.1 pilus assembly protein [Kitasatospora purpeofusca]WSR33703.1 pilus assembly protein [Kitasatospora purpeofusca]WSR41837.1 pilus assembly protein [Kitasatospora purpeofusca]
MRPDLSSGPSPGQRPPVRRRGRRRGDAGFVTAETAVALPALVLLAALLVWAVLAAAAQLRCVDAAREGARAAARGEADAVGVARAAAPPGAAVLVDLAPDTVRVTVDAPYGAPGRFAEVLAVRVGATAVAAREDTLKGAEGGGGPWPG